MSLINDVLNDLNQKSKLQTTVANCHIETPFNETKTWYSRHAKSLIVGFFVVNMCCLFAVYGFKQVQKKSSHNLVVLSPPKTVKPEAKNIFEISSEIPPISFSEFQLKKKYTSEKFLRNQTEAAQVQKDIKKVEAVTIIDSKGKNKDTFFIKKFSPLSMREKSEKIYQNVLELLEHQQYRKAEVLLDKVISSDPSYIEPRQLQVQLFLSQGELDKANQLADKNLNDFPDNSLFVELKANVLLQLGYADQALAMLKKYAPQMDEGSADYYNLMAVAFEKLEKLTEAGGIYQQLVRIKPDKAAYWLGLAIAFEATKQPNQAIGAYSKAIDAYDNSSIISTYAKSRLQLLRG